MEASSTAKVVIAAVLVVAGIGVYVGCRRCNDGNGNLPIPIPVSSDPVLVDAAPSAVPEAAPPAVPVGDEGVLKNLPGVGSYHNKSQCLQLTSKAATEEQWGLPYPIHLVITQATSERAVDLDCGLFPTLQQDAWRLGYCLEENKRVPRKLYLRVQEGKLALQVDYRGLERTANIYTGFEPGECK